MSVQSKEEGDVLIVYLTEKRIIDQVRIREIGKQLMALSGQCPRDRMLLNFKGVELMSSAMLGEIVRLNNKCNDADIDLRLCEIAPQIMKVFKIMKLPVKIEKTEEKALASFDKKSIFG